MRQRKSFSSLWFCTLSITVCFVSVWLDRTAADDVNPGPVDRHIKAGEFGLARQAVGGIAHRGPMDQVLAQIASAQSSSGDITAAGNTIRQIVSPDQRQQAIGAARGGGAFADFDSLIQLIQTTVAPDTWEALGGPSTMAQYPQGIYVDPQGTVMRCQTVAADDPLASIQNLLQDPSSANSETPDAWQLPSRLRFVSLRRLRDAMTDHRISGTPTPDSMLHLAGLSRIQYLILAGDDIVIAGPVGGIKTDGGWFRDQNTGDNAIRSDFLFTCLASAIGNQAFGCTIDPSPAGLQAAAAVGAQIKSNQIPIGKAATEMRNALGMQRVEVFGTAGDTVIGYLMVEADRHMKELALGKEEMPHGVKNYLDIIDDTIAQGPPDQLLLRLWFTASPQSVRADQNREVFELGGPAIVLSGQNRRALASGARGDVTVDPRTQNFVDQFNRHFQAIREKYPVYGALESIYRAAAVAHLMDQHVKNDASRALIQSLAVDSSNHLSGLATPTQVESIATLHKVRHGRTIHNVLLASGGVAVNLSETLKEKISDYETLTSLRRPAESAPSVIQSWWWDASNR